MAADFFVFASNVDDSPLALFEAVAAGTPFLTVRVGNAEETVFWTIGGVICPAVRDRAPGVARIEVDSGLHSGDKFMTEPCDSLRLLFKVAVHDEYAVANRSGGAGHDGLMLAEIAMFLR